MATQGDMLIFVTGVVGRSMGSGKFGRDEIVLLAKEAESAFRDVFGEPQPEATIPSQSSSAPAGEQEKLFGVAVADALGKPFRLWKNDKLYFPKTASPFGKPWAECSWAEVLQNGLAGSDSSEEMLKWLLSIPVSDDQYKQHNLRRNARAEVILNALKSAKKK